MKNKKYLSMAVALAVMAAGSSVFAADVADFGDEEVVVTATRTVKREIDVPASTEIITAEQIKESGVQSVEEALKYVTGFTYKSSGPLGMSRGGMTNEVNVRGLQEGMLILLNGNPISLKGKYDLSALSTANIEKIEIVKGNGSVLYGSSASAGVVNIITKQGVTSNSATIGIGNRGQSKYNLTVGDDRALISYNKQVYNNPFIISNYAVYEYKKKKKTESGGYEYIVSDHSRENVLANYKINDKWNITYNFAESISTVNAYYYMVTKKNNKIGDLSYDDSHKYIITQHNFNTTFKDNDWKINLFGNTGYITDIGAKNARERHTTYGVDAQKTWHLNDKSSLTSGFNYNRVSYKQVAYNSDPNRVGLNGDRNVWAVFAELDQKFDNKNSMIIGARETWTTGASAGNKNYSNFSASGQWLHKMADNANLYVSVAQSFKMPTFTQYMVYSNNGEVLELKPQKGINYEIGVKANNDANTHIWKAALFHMNIKDKITGSFPATGILPQYENEEFKNTGIELSCNIKSDSPWSYNYGLLWQNPMATKTTKANEVFVNGVYGKIQLNGSVTYKMGKFSSTLSAAYLANRFGANSTTNVAERMKPSLLTTWNFVYSPCDDSEFALTIDNVLSRRDIISHSATTTGRYYTQPTCVMLSYTQKF